MKHGPFPRRRLCCPQRLKQYYSPLRLPHHRRARDDRHSLAQASRFIDENVKGLLSIEEVVPRRRGTGTDGLPAARPAAVAQALDLESLWR